MSAMHGQRVDSSFHPAWWLPGGHLQTLWASLVRRAPRITLRRERLELADGDFLDLDWTPGESGPIVLILHGLQGSSNSPYARGLMAACHARGWRAVVMHFRGCSGEPNRLPRAYHSGETTDLASVIAILKKREPGTPVVAVGYSLGGNVLLKWLAERDTTHPVEAAVAVSVPYLLDQGAKRLNQGISRLYQGHLMSSLIKSIVNKRHILDGHIELDRVRKLRRIYDFDDIVTAPLHGFASADNYYKLCSSRPVLSAIDLPTLLLHARNDPFMTPACVPAAHELSASTRLEISDDGGHVGFVSGNWPWRARYWLENRIMAFLAEHLADKTGTGQMVQDVPFINNTG
jgi:predicted alpha/beta-fold hydrolase